MHSEKIRIKTTDDIEITVKRSDLIAHIANYQITYGVKEPGFAALTTHMSYSGNFSDDLIAQMWEEKKHVYQADLANKKTAFGMSDAPFDELEFDPTDLSKLSEMKPDYMITITNELGEEIEIKRELLEERIALRDADIQWTAITQAFQKEAQPRMTADLIALFREGYNPPSKMFETTLVANWEETKDGFYRSCTEFDLAENLSPEDPEYDRLTSVPALGVS